MDAATLQTGAYRILDEELDIEIGLRTRMLEVLQGRIAWAQTLQNTMRAGIPAPANTQDEFKSTATTSLSTIESPCQNFFSRPSREPSQDASSLSMKALQALEQTSLRNFRSRPATKPRPVAPAIKLLFIRYSDPDAPSGPLVVAKLACTICHRTNFPTIQGLVNHCRMAHQIHWGSHDDCIAACATPILDGEERQSTLSQGTEVPAGVSLSFPSLRRLFALAVGEGNEVVMQSQPTENVAPMSKSRKNSPMVINPEEAALVLKSDARTEGQDPASRSTHASRTLGHHKDSPALATFLGRESRRRCINIYEEEEDVDIGVEATPVEVTPSWRMSFGTRSHIPDVDRDQCHPDDFDSAREDTGAADLAEYNAPKAISTDANRFHITARVVIADRSLWMPASTVNHENHTHQWMITVSAPSYAKHESTFVKSITVSCLTESFEPGFSVETFNTARNVPFYVRGTTDRPFLAQVEIHWAPSSSDRPNVPANPPIRIEQWVDIGPEKYVHPVLGEEQVLDVELDRGTTFFDERHAASGFDWETRATTSGTLPLSEETAQPQQLDETQSYAQRLTWLLPRFPLTMKDVKARHLPRVPYSLVPTVAHLKSLTYGRRKAIELARSRAICEAYNVEHTSNDDIQNISSLRTADVFRWLEDNNYFARTVAPSEEIRKYNAASGHEQAEQKRPDGSSTRNGSNPFCANCGSDLRLHTATIAHTSTETTKTNGHDQNVCTLATANQSPVNLYLDVSKLTPAVEPVGEGRSAYGISHEAWLLSTTITTTTSTHDIHGSDWTPNHTRSALESADPNLVTAVMELTCTATKELSKDQSFPSINNNEDAGKDTQQNKNKALESPAVLALALKPFVTRLLGGGVSQLRRQQAEAARLAMRDGAVVSTDTSSLLLTPQHVLRGVREGAYVDGCSAAVFVLLSAFGLPTER